jgi:hypothetical protein
MLANNATPQISKKKKRKKKKEKKKTNHWWGPLRFDFVSFVMGISVRVHSPKGRALKGVLKP